MKDVAALAGVSQTTVSFVMNNVPGLAITPETEDRVRQAIKELGYRPNAAAKTLRTQRSHSLGFVTDVLASSPFAGDIVLGAQQAAWRHAHLLTIVNTEGDPTIEETAVEELLERRVDGVIYASMAHRQVAPPESLREVPTVLVNCFSEEPVWASAVPDEFLGGQLATRALTSAGHRRIGITNLDPLIIAPPSEGRLAGYRAALAEVGVAFDTELVRNGDGDADGGYRMALELMRLPNPPTAIFCATDRMAMGAYDAIRDLGWRIPDDVSIVGFDNQEIIARFLRPALSTVALPFYELGHWAVRALLGEGEESLDAIQHKIACTYVERNSVAPPASPRPRKRAART